jgi:arylformamidase
LDAIVSEVRAAVAWIITHAEEIGGDPRRVFVAGHSAGAPDGHGVHDARGRRPVSGLRPGAIRLCYLNDRLGLDPLKPATARSSTCPRTHTHRGRSRPDEPELIRQSDEYARAWQGRGLSGRYLPLIRHEHFSILEELARPGGALLAALRELAAPT